jgi:hypothetical protein
MPEGSHLGPPLFVDPPLDRGGLATPAHPESDPVEPTADGIGIADRAGLAPQHEECRLERVLGIVRVAEDLSADPEHHRSMALHQGREGRSSLSFVGAQAPLEELPVREVADHSDSR